MFWKQSEGGLETEKTCSAQLRGREQAKRLLPICLSGYGAVLTDLGGKPVQLIDRPLLQHRALNAWS